MIKWYAQDEFSGQELEISNNMITTISVEMLGHFGNLPSLKLIGYDRVIMRNYNNLDNLGYILRELMNFFTFDTESGLDIAKIKDVPCRIITDKKNNIVAIGHFICDRFIKMDELIAIKDGEVKKDG